jgi:hypothetical protein
MPRDGLGLETRQLKDRNDEVHFPASPLNYFKTGALF